MIRFVLAFNDDMMACHTRVGEIRRSLCGDDVKVIRRRRIQRVAITWEDVVEGLALCRRKISLDCEVKQCMEKLGQAGTEPIVGGTGGGCPWASDVHLRP